LVIGVAFACLIESAYATIYSADPRSYIERLAQLKPGDRLQLAPGTYRDGLSINGIHGSDEQPIVIEGSTSGAPTVFQGVSGHNTVSLRNASFVVIKNLILDGGGLDVDGVKAEHGGGVVHHITLEGLTIIGHGDDQQTVGISTKTPAANWTIRNNLIVGAGTGMYLGDSDGSAPFISGLIESNVIVDTLGYNLQIKQQQTRPFLSQLPTTAQRTVIRGNIFSKAANASTGN
jgi:nitrous oxidase accessory protein NosD